MGFTTGFTGGVTLTLGLAYLSVLAHERNRQNQAQALRSQSRVLQGLLEPTPLPPPQSRADLAREERSTLIEAVKDRWNNEIENVVRRVQTTDWNEVREEAESTIGRLIGGGLQKSREGIDQAEKSAGPKVQEAVDRSKAAAEKASAEAKRQLDHASVKATELPGAAKAKAEKALNTGAGTVDAARGAVRDVISKGIEKGKEVIGIATEKVESKIQGAGGANEVEKALHERYEEHNALNKSVEQTLEERYKPVDTRDSTVLRGV